MCLWADEEHLYLKPAQGEESMEVNSLSESEMSLISAGALADFVDGLCVGTAIADAAVLFGVIAASGFGLGLLATGSLFCLGREIYLRFS